MIGCVATASASAHEFIASSTGKLDGGGSGYTFTTSAGIKGLCEESNVWSGSMTSLKQEVLAAGIAYFACAAEGQHMTLESAEYDFNANGTATLAKAYSFEILIESFKSKCRFTFSPSGGEEETVTYTNSSPVNTVQEHRVAKNMQLTVVGSLLLCGPKEQTASMEETTSIGVEGGTLTRE